MKIIQKTILIIFCSFITILLSNAQEKRNLLSDSFTRKFVRESLSKDDSWIKYPSYNDREAWSQLPETLRQKNIEEGEKFINFDWPQVTATMYLEFTRTGNRAIVDNANNQRRRALQALSLAELFEGKGRFLDDIINGILLICEQTYWGSSAHFYMYGFDGEIANPTTTVPDIEDPIIDLVVGDMAADLSWIYYFFHKEFDKISPIISKRLKQELQKKVLDPFYERYDYWWITGWGTGNVNNWNPWCNYNMLTCILLMEEDPDKKLNGIYKTMQSVDLFINAYPSDGGCDEGPSYWGVAAGKLFDYLDLLKTSSQDKINIFDNDLVKNMGRYIYRVYISNGMYYANFADAPMQIRHEPSKIYRYGRSIKDQDLQSFGAFLMKQAGIGSSVILGRIGEVMETLFNSSDWENIQPTEPLVSDFYFPDLEIAIGREKGGSTDGFYFAAKGGTNGEQHNHNDVGSFILFYNGIPVLIDVGVGTYTAKTFSEQRYEIWTMQSTYHNLPLINGIPQSPGGQYKASNSSYKATNSKVSFTTDITKAYPAEAKVQKWIRGYTLDRKKGFFINDNFQLTENQGKTELHFLTPWDCNITKPGSIELKKDNITMVMNYKPSEYEAEIQTINIDDPKLRGVHGDMLSMIVLKIKTVKAGNYTTSLSVIK
jgi:hypothetical protein